MNTFIETVCEHCKGTGKRKVVNHHALRQRRLYVGISLRRVAAELGVSAAYLSDVERGNRRATEGLLKFYSIQNLRNLRAV